MRKKIEAMLVALADAHYQSLHLQRNPMLSQHYWITSSPIDGQTMPSRSYCCGAIYYSNYKKASFW